MAAAGTFSIERCARTVDSLRQSFDHFDVRPHPTSDVGQMMAELEWMASFSEDPLCPGGAIDADKKRALGGLAHLPQAEQLGRVLAQCQTVRGAEKKVRILGKKLDRVFTVDTPAQDALVELEVAARLARYLDDVVLADPPSPDVVCTIPGFTPIGWECKRPRNLTRARALIEKAVDQINAQHAPSVIVVDVQAMLYATGDPVRPVYFYTMEHPSELQRVHGAAIERMIAELEHDLDQAFAAGVLAVCFWAITWGLASEPSSYVFQSVARWVSNPALQGDPLADALALLVA